MNLYFKNIRVVNPAQKLDDKLNLFIKDGVIAHCSKSEVEIDNETKVIEGDDLVASPGFFDYRVKVGEPGFEYKETIKSAANAASNGAYTGFVMQPDLDPVVDNVTVVEFIKNKAKDLITDVIPAGSITQGIEGNLISPMLELNDAGVAYFSDAETPSLDTETLRRALDYAATKQLLLSLHTQDPKLTQNFVMNESPLSYRLGLKGYPSMAEEMVVSRNILMAEFCGKAKMHLQHISTKGSVDFIRTGKHNNPNLTCGVSIVNLILDESEMVSYDTNLKVNPPLRSKNDIEALIEAINDDTIDIIISDHQPHSLNEKEVELENAPYGIIGLETTLGLVLTHLVHTKKVSLEKVIEKMSITPREILGLPQIIIDEGNQANLSIFNLNEEWIVDHNKFKSESTNTPFIGYSLKGKPKYTINSNKFVECDL